ncbi:lipoprotein [Streptomyces davaonensis JCM 4913]|uniref:Lipoprotein n=2 Tax=Streptomyces davaonensis TaxID=348043 RepID=K4RFE4_STRDJ|nr:lipoprotein [Streptomyces davaonensis JCM 4913]
MTLRDEVPAQRNLSNLIAMRDHPHGEHAPHPDVWTGRATNRVQWLLALVGAACMALGIELAVDSAWTSGVAPLAMAVVGCIAAGLLVLFGTLAFVHVALKVDKECLEVRCGHMGVPRRRIPLSHVVGADFAPLVTPRHWGGWGYRWRPEKGTAVVVRRGEGIVLRLWDGHTFTITVDDAEAAVRVIRARLGAGTPGTAH